MCVCVVIKMRHDMLIWCVCVCVCVCVCMWKCLFFNPCLFWGELWIHSRMSWTKSSSTLNEIIIKVFSRFYWIMNSSVNPLWHCTLMYRIVYLACSIITCWCILTQKGFRRFLWMCFIIKENGCFSSVSVAVFEKRSFLKMSSYSQMDCINVLYLYYK